VTALGKFQDLSGDAERAAVNAIATEITGGSNINYAKSLIGTPAIRIGDATAGVDVDAGTEACNDVDIASLLRGNAIPAVNGKVVALTSSTEACAAVGDDYTCAVTLGGIALNPVVTTTLVCTDT
ncbi:MAG: hypothetical protein GY806_08830, partial [Gammaproteobacteria bacterium]|nr:hypothetical protein [Gammaproteobacteria bacterium]